MITLQLPDREPIVMSDERASLLYDALWANATDVRGSISAAAQIKRTIAYSSVTRTPIKFEGDEAAAVTTALDAPGVRRID